MVCSIKLHDIATIRAARQRSPMHRPLVTSHRTQFSKPSVASFANLRTPLEQCHSLPIRSLPRTSAAEGLIALKSGDIVQKHIATAPSFDMLRRTFDWGSFFFIILPILRLGVCIKYPLNAWTTITSKRKSWKRLENCQKFALNSRPEMHIFGPNWQT